MNQSTCPQWEAQMASTHPQDLQPEDHAALHNHLMACTICRTAWETDRQIDQYLRLMLWQDLLRDPLSDIPSLPPQLVRLWQWTERQREK